MPDVREKLVELLKKTPIAEINGHIAKAEVCFVSHVFESMADHLIANGVTIQRWIPVTERLPDKQLRVLVLTGMKGMIVARHTEVGWVVAWNNAQCPKITHWMPLPEPPKEE